MHAFKTPDYSPILEDDVISAKACYICLPSLTNVAGADTTPTPALASEDPPPLRGTLDRPPPPPPANEEEFLSQTDIYLNVGDDQAVP